MRLEGMSQRQIAATLHISRNTVKKYWNGDSVPWERKAYSRKPCVLTEDVVAFVQQCLDEEVNAVVRNNITQPNESMTDWWRNVNSPAARQQSGGW